MFRRFVILGVFLLALTSCVGGLKKTESAVKLLKGKVEEIVKNEKNLEPISALEIPLLEALVQEELIPHLGYTVSFNSDTRLPNWVAYELTSEETQGEEPRAKHFRSDPMVSGAQAENDDYRNTGWDRGHMAPAADMKWGRKAMEESFYFSNVCPQNRNLNRGDWKELEERCRLWAKQYDRVWIACGPIVGEAKQGTIGRNKVVIPDAFYKVLLVQTNGMYEGIGFVFENKAGKRKLKTYAQTIDQVEALTQIDFYRQLPDSIEQHVESCYHLDVWNLN